MGFAHGAGMKGESAPERNSRRPHFRYASNSTGGDDRLSVRGRDPRRDRCRVRRRCKGDRPAQALHALRNGTMPGSNLRRGGRGAARAAAGRGRRGGGRRRRLPSGRAMDRTHAVASRPALGARGQVLGGKTARGRGTDRDRLQCLPSPAGRGDCPVLSESDNIDT